MEIDLRSRDFLHALEKEAFELSRVKGVNQFWKSVYRRLAEVACELDAFIARSSVPNRLPNEQKQAN